MRNIIEISTKILEVSKDTQAGLISPITYEDIVDCRETVKWDRDLLLTHICREFQYDLDWGERLVTTNKRSYDIEEFLLKFISNGRRALKNQQYITL
jgi:hypothetical protein